MLDSFPELAAAAALMFFLPGLSAVLAFAERGSRWRNDIAELIAASVGISVAISLILLFLLTLLSEAYGQALNFSVFIAALVAVAGIFLVIAASGRSGILDFRRHRRKGNNARR